MNLDIGEWGAHEEAVGTSFLKDAASGEDALAIMWTLGASPYTMFKTLSDVGMNERSRTAIIEHADMFHAEKAIEEADLIVPLSHAQLLGLVGEEVDVTPRTMQVVLNDESEYDGGRLVYDGGRLVYATPQMRSCYGPAGKQAQPYCTRTP